MSFLRVSSYFVGLQRFHPSPIARVLLHPRLKSLALQQSRWPFGASLLRLRHSQLGDRRAPLRQRQPQQLQDEHDKHDESNNRVPPPRYSNSPNIVVGSIIAICICVFGYSQIVRMGVASNASSESMAAMRALNTHFVHTPEDIKQGRYYTIITSAFMHGSIMHLLFNMVGLWSFGRLVVSIYGASSFLVLYFGSIITGGLTQDYAWELKRESAVGAVGASGGVLGVFAAMACGMPRAPMSMLFVPMPMWVAAGLTVGISVGGLQDRWLPTFGHADHLGGMAFGAFWWLVAMRRGRILRI